MALPDRRSELARRTELKRTGINRGTSRLARTEFKRVAGRIRQRSAKRARQQPARDAVRAETFRRAGGRCEGEALWPEIECWGPLEVDEVIGRGVRPGAELEIELTQLVCRGHHDACGQSSPLRAEAEARGMRFSAHQYDEAVRLLARRRTRQGR